MYPVAAQPASAHPKQGTTAVAPRNDCRQSVHARGAIGAKLAIVVALGAGVLWSAPFAPLSPPAESLWVVTTPLAQKEVALPATDTALEPSSPSDEARDPFAGVDVGSNPVLRHIATIVEPRRADPAADARPRPAPERVPAPPRATTTADALRTPPPPVQPAPVPAAPEASAPALAARIVDPAPVTAPPVTRAPADAAGKQAAAPDQRAPATSAAVAAPAADMNRGATARVDTPPAPPPAVVPPRAVLRTVPVFPGEAIKAGIKTGRVLARVTIDGNGRVTDSEIVSALPPGYFERASQRALSSWRYEPSGRSASAEVELLFARE